MEHAHIPEILRTLKRAVTDINRNSKNHLTSFKDFMPNELTHFDQAAFKKDLKFSSQLAKNLCRNYRLTMNCRQYAT
jgi:hypothetical protein